MALYCLHDKFVCHLWRRAEQFNSDCITANVPWGCYGWTSRYYNVSVVPSTCRYHILWKTSWNCNFPAIFQATLQEHQPGLAGFIDLSASGHVWNIAARLRISNLSSNKAWNYHHSLLNYSWVTPSPELVLVIFFEIFRGELCTAKF